MYHHCIKNEGLVQAAPAALALTKKDQCQISFVFTLKIYRPPSPRQDGRLRDLFLDPPQKGAENFSFLCIAWKSTMLRCGVMSHCVSSGCQQDLHQQLHTTRNCRSFVFSARLSPSRSIRYIYTTVVRPPSFVPGMISCRVTPLQRELRLFLCANKSGTTVCVEVVELKRNR